MLSPYDMYYWLYLDVYEAYYCARIGKRKTENQLKFESWMEDYLEELIEDLIKRRYEISPCIVFLIS